MSPKITVFLITCREDYSILGLKDLHIFTPLIESLNNQSFKDFELIIIDSLHKWRNTSPINEAKFKVTHIPPKPSPWLNIGHFHSSNSVNTAILHAKGKILVGMCDCMEFDSNYLDKIWKHFMNGYIALPTFTYLYEYGQVYYHEELIDELIKKGSFSKEEIANMKHGWSVYELGDPVRDTRYNQTSETTKIVNHEWYYGISVLPLKDALEVNGNDENFDGSHGTLDVDVGSRLEMKGCYPFLYDKTIITREHLHEGLSPRIIKDYRPNWKTNLALYQLNREHKRIKANTHKLTQTEIDHIADQTDPECYDEELFKYWMENQLTFNLEKMREVIK